MLEMWEPGYTVCLNRSGAIAAAVLVACTSTWPHVLSPITTIHTTTSSCNRYSQLQADTNHASLAARAAIALGGSGRRE
jgi:hypothetical protein